MKKSDELKKVVDQLVAKAKELQQNERYDDADAVVKDLTTARRDYKNALAIEAAEMEDFQQGARPAKKVDLSDKAMVNRVFNKLVLGRPLTAEEREYANTVGTPGQVGATPEKGGYLVPEEQMTQLREYRKAYTALKPFCNVQTANSTSGKAPTLGDETGKLIQFDELTDINKDDISFGQITYSIKDYGDIIPVSNQILQDADVNLMQVIGQRFARKAINTENAEILGLLSGLSATAITGYKQLMKALNVDLDPSYYAGARIFTNQDGFQWLAELEDGQKRPLLVPDVAAPDTYRFRGKEVVVLSNNTLASNAAKKTIPFYVGSMADYVAFFQRLGVEVAVSQEAGFVQYSTLIRAVERFGVVKDDVDALKAYTVSTATT